MPPRRSHLPLTDTRIKNAKPREKPFRLFDGLGLYLEIAAAGGKWWRLKYRFDGKEKRLSLGTYPGVSLKEARKRRDEARKLLSNGVDPGVRRKALKAARAEANANSFEVVAREWFGKYGPNWAPSHSSRVIRLFERDIFPRIGTKAIAELTAVDLLAVLRRIEDRGAIDTAHRARTNCSQVFRYAVASARCARDPLTDLRGALSPVKKEHFAATVDPAKLAGILRAMDGYDGDPVVRCALRLMPLLFVRPGELRHARWNDVDLEAAEWRYLVTKTNTQHVVPLATQALHLLRELKSLTGDGVFVFPGARSAQRPMSDNAVLAALRRMGIGKDEMTGHGFRAAARTLLDEALGFPPHLIEHQLAHRVQDALGRSYNRTSHLPERKSMMAAWADYLDGLKRS